MKQIINDLPKINPELYLSSAIIKNVQGVYSDFSS